MRGFQIKKEKLAVCPCCTVALGRFRTVAGNHLFFVVNSNMIDVNTLISDTG